MKTVIKLFLLILTVSFVVKAQTLDSLISEGLLNNPGIKALEKNIRSAQFKSQSAGYLPPPTLGVEFSQVPVKDPDPFKNSLSQNIFLSQMFMPGGKLSAMEEAEYKRTDILRTDLNEYRLKLKGEITKSYYDIWMMEHHIGLEEDNISFLEEIGKSVEQNYMINRTTYSDVLLIKAEIAAAKSGIEVMENDLNSMYFMMNSLLGRTDRNSEIVVRHNWEPDVSDIDTSALKNMLLENNPSLQKMNRMQEMNSLEINANRKELFPDLMLQAMLMRMPQGMLLTSKTPVHSLDGMGETEYMFSVMASVTLPFAPWASGKIRTREEELLSSTEGISLEKENMRIMLESQFYGLVNSAESAKKEMRLLKYQVIPLYRQTMDSQLNEFRNNRNTIVNILQTLKMLLMKEEELAEVITRYQKTLAEIETISAGDLIKR